MFRTKTIWVFSEVSKYLPCPVLHSKKWYGCQNILFLLRICMIFRLFGINYHVPSTNLCISWWMWASTASFSSTSEKILNTRIKNRPSHSLWLSLRVLIKDKEGSENVGEALKVPKSTQSATLSEALSLKNLKKDPSISYEVFLGIKCRNRFKGSPSELIC